jgi:hypothetical protein
MTNQQSPVPTDERPPMTEREILQRVDRMILHLDRLLANRDMSQDDYDAALRDLSEWEETAMLKTKGEEQP